MARTRIVVGIIAGLLLLASSGAHAFVGWPAIHQQLLQSSANPDLINGIKMAWMFGGACMIAFGFIVLLCFRSRLRSIAFPLWPALIIACIYVAFGIYAYTATHGDPFAFLFLGPGVLLLFASTGEKALKAERSRT